MINHAINSFDKHPSRQARPLVTTGAIRAPFSAPKRVADHRFDQGKIDLQYDFETTRSIDEVIFRFIQEQPSQLYRGGA